MDLSPEMPQEYIPAREGLLTEFSGKNLEGMNIERVGAFMKEKGLEIKPFIVLSSQDVQRANDILTSAGLPLPDGLNGNYFTDIDVVVVVRNQDLENMYDIFNTEGVLVHELAHANTMRLGYVVDQYQPRIGLFLPQNKTQNQVAWGHFIEEGWAELHRGEYNAKYLPKVMKAKLQEGLNLQRFRPEDTVMLIDKEGNGLPLPTKYFLLDKEGAIAYNKSSYAGYSFELLCNLDPQLRKLLIEGRQSVEGLRKLSRAIDRIKPGLYKSLQFGEDSEEVFRKKLALVLSCFPSEVTGKNQKKGIRFRTRELCGRFRNKITRKTT